MYKLVAFPLPLGTILMSLLNLVLKTQHSKPIFCCLLPNFKLFRTLQVF